MESESSGSQVPPDVIFPWLPLNNALETWTVLQRLKIPSRLVGFSEENHWILKGEDSRLFDTEVHAWLAKYLGSSPSPRAARDAQRTR